SRAEVCAEGLADRPVGGLACRVHLAPALAERRREPRGLGGGSGAVDALEDDEGHALTRRRCSAARTTKRTPSAPPPMPAQRSQLGRPGSAVAVPIPAGVVEATGGGGAVPSRAARACASSFAASLAWSPSGSSVSALSNASAALSHAF